MVDDPLGQDHRVGVRAGRVAHRRRCGGCGSRMLLDFATNPRGTTYAYFVCSGRASKKTTCTRRAVPVQVAERLVEDSYVNITISEDDYRHLAAG